MCVKSNQAGLFSYGFTQSNTGTHSGVGMEVKPELLLSGKSELDSRWDRSSNFQKGDLKSKTIDNDGGGGSGGQAAAPVSTDEARTPRASFWPTSLPPTKMTSPSALSGRAEGKARPLTFNPCGSLPRPSVNAAPPSPRSHD